VAEWSIAPILKTSNGKPFVSLAGLEEAVNAIVPEASNHPEAVERSATRSKCSSNPLGVRIPEK